MKYGYEIHIPMTGYLSFEIISEKELSDEELLEKAFDSDEVTLSNIVEWEDT